ncbi:MAG: hypothetical protein HYX39_09930 [Bacteroidetes bacterium]|nr:hypothetical protein [Bacteroidota bacterium]
MENIITVDITLKILNDKLIALQSLLLKKDTSISLWIPLFSSIVGGLLVWVGQSLERRYRKKIDAKNMRLEIYAYCRKLEAEMRNNYRELAMAKTHAEYWWFCHNFSEAGNKIKNYDEHLRSQTFAREIERRIGETKAAFIGHVRKFQAIKELPDSIEKRLNDICDLTHQKAKVYSATDDYNKIRNEQIEKDEEVLRNIYYRNMVHFKTINDHLQSLI